MSREKSRNQEIIKIKLFSEKRKKRSGREALTHHELPIKKYHFHTCSYLIKQSINQI